MSLISFLQAAGALVAVTAAIILIGRIARQSRFVQRNGRATSRLGLIESLTLDPRRRLLLIHCEGRLVLLLAGQQDQVVGWLPERSA